MIVDKELRFSDDQAITASAASTVTLNKGAVGGPYRGPFLVVNCKEDFDLLTSLKISLETSDDNFSADTVELVSKTVLLADLVANAKLMRVQIPLGVKEYLRMYYTVTGTTATAGKIWAGIVPDVKED